MVSKKKQQLQKCISAPIPRLKSDGAGFTFLPKQIPKPKLNTLFEQIQNQYKLLDVKPHYILMTK